MSNPNTGGKPEQEKPLPLAYNEWGIHPSIFKVPGVFGGLNLKPVDIKQKRKGRKAAAR